MPQITVHAISGDGKVLKGMNTGYISEPPDTATIRSTTANKENAMFEFYETLENKETELKLGVSSIFTQIKPSRTPGYRWSAILRKVNNNTLRSVTGSQEPNEVPLQTAVREFGEETGNIIDQRFFIPDLRDPNVFYLRIDTSVKDRLLENYQSLSPFTEMARLSWVTNTDGLVAPNGDTVGLGNIAQHPDSILSNKIRKTFYNLNRVSKKTTDFVLNAGRKTIRRKKTKRTKKHKILKRK